MIILNLHKLMGEKRLRLVDMEKLTGVHYTVLSKYYNDNIKRLDKGILNKICIALQCDISDLLEFKEISEDK